MIVKSCICVCSLLLPDELLYIRYIGKHLSLVTMAILNVDCLISTHKTRDNYISVDVY